MTDHAADPRRLAGKVAVVTGGGKGIGEAEATLLARQGARVVVADIGVDDGVSRAERVAATLRSDGCDAVAYTDDIATFAGARGLIEAAVDTFGGIHIVVNNAGLRAGGPITEIDEDDYDVVLDSHLRATYGTIKFAAPHFVRQQAGVIVNTSSESGLGHAYNTAYAAAKEAVTGLTRSVARELGMHGVRCNQVRPNAQETTKVASFVATMQRAKPHYDQLGRYWLGTRGDLRRPSRPADVATLVTWLCTDAAASLNGQDFLVMGAEYGVWTEPDICRSAVLPGGWTLSALDEWAPQLLVHGLTNRFLTAPVPAGD